MGSAFLRISITLGLIIAAEIPGQSQPDTGSLDKAGDRIKQQKPESVVCALFGLPLEKEPLKGKTPEEVAEYLKESGVNAVVHVPLKEDLIKALRARDIRCYGEASFFAAGEALWNASPESRPILADGKPLEKAGWYAGTTPTFEKHVEDVLQSIREQCSKYELDGVWLDFIRWPTRWEMREPMLFKTDYSNKTLERFQREAGVALPATLTAVPEKAAWIDAHVREKWITWRCEVIHSIVKKVRGIVHEHRGPKALVGIFYVPLLRDEYDGAIVNIVGQDAKRLSDVVDVFSPMSYHGFCERDTKWITRLTEDIRRVSPCRIWPIVQASSEPRPIPPDEYRETLLAGLRGGSTGVMAFTANDVLGTPLWEVQRKVFRSMQGLESDGTPTPAP